LSLLYIDFGGAGKGNRQERQRREGGGTENGTELVAMSWSFEGLELEEAVWSIMRKRELADWYKQVGS
jgi:hypothetical protein